MTEKFKFNGKDYEISNLSKAGKKHFDQLQRIDHIVKDKNNLTLLLLRAKKAYASDLKSEMLSEKAGFDFTD